MIRYVLTLSLFICSCLPIWGQEHQWNEPFFVNLDLGGSLRFDTQIDSSGNTYVISVFKDEVTILDTTLYSSIHDGVFLAKFDENHNLLWAKLLAEAKEETPNFRSVLGRVSIEIDKITNYIYPSIGYGDSVFIENQFYTVEQSQEYYQDFVILKMSEDGVTEDMYHFKGSCESYLGDAKVTDEYLYFHFNNTRSQFDTDSICTCSINSDTTIYSAKNETILGRINHTNSSLDWIKTYRAGSGISPTEADVIAVNESSIYITGSVYSSASDLVIDEDTLIANYNKYGYIARLNLEGEHKWSKYYGAYGFDSYAIAEDIAINSDDDIVLAANVKTQSVMNRVYFTDGSYLSGAQNNDESFFVVNYDSLGNIKWKDISESIGYERLHSVASDSDKNIYLMGKYNDQITFGNTILEANTFSNDIIVLSYDSVGNKRWAQKAGDNGSDIGSVIHVDTDNNLRVAGVVSGSTATFGAYETNPPSPGNSIFVAQMKLEPIGLEENTPQQFGVSLYPNPSLGNTHVEIQDEFISQIRVYNALSQEIQTLHFENQTNKASIENLVSGYYIIDIHSLSGKRVSQKLIVQ